MNTFLRLFFYQNKDGNLRISKYPLIDSTVVQFGLVDPKSVSTPVASGARIYLNEESEPLDGTYSQLVGVLLYPSITVRRDISSAVGRLARFCAKKKYSHWMEEATVLRYLMKTRVCSITNRTELDLYLLVVVDSNFAGEHVDRT